MSADELHRLVKTLHPYEVALLQTLESEMVNLNVLAAQASLEDIQARRAVQWLANKGIVEEQTIIRKIIRLGSNGLSAREHGLPETRLRQAATTIFTPVKQLQKEAKLADDEVNIAIGSLKKKLLIELENKEGTLTLKLAKGADQEKESPEERFLKNDFPLPLDSLEGLERFAYDNLAKRKDILITEDEKAIEARLTAEGKNVKALAAQTDFSKVKERLTPTMLADGSWKQYDFKHFDVETPVPSIDAGRRHFVNQAIEYMKQIWIELGFEEMSGDCCQTSFWNLDALFMPQDHPAREMQDTFFLAGPDGKGIMEGTLPKDLAQEVKAVQEHGGTTGSRGWGDAWQERIAQEVLLRTHTTVLSAQYIHRHLQRDNEGRIIPRKFFSVAKVYRNEALDWKHLFEFNQVEGIVVDPDATFGNLIGYLKLFFRKMGFSDVRVKPSYFPYTEPSAEIEAFNPHKQEWVEMGGAGIFRPEVTKALIGEEIPVLAWGLGMERIIMEYYALTDIRDLYRNDLKQLKEMKAWMKVSE